VVRQQWVLFGLTFIALALSVGLQLALAGVFGNSFTALAAHQPGQLTRDILLFALLGFLMPVVSMAATYGRFLLATRITIRLRGDLMERIVYAPIGVHDRQLSGDLQTRLSTDMGVIWETVHHHVLNLLQDPLYLIGSLLYLWILSPTLALILFPLGPLLYVANVLWQKPLYDRSRTTRETNSRLAQLGLDIMKGILSIQALRAERELLSRYRDVLKDLYRVHSREWHGLTSLWMVTGWLGWIPFVAIMAVGGRLFLAGQITIGTLVVVIQVMNMFTAPYSRIARSWGGLQTGKASLDRIQNWETATEVPALPDLPASRGEEPPSAPRSPTVRAEGVSFAYPEAALVLRDVTFSIPAQRVTVLAGPNGSGKSTLTKLLMGFYQPRDGRILWDDVPYTQLGSRWIRRHMVYVAQEPFLMAGTVRENLILALGDTSEPRLREMLAQVGLPDSDAFLHQDIGEQGKALSGGQRLRLVMARALLREAPLLVFDEPTASLDPAGRDAFVDLLRGLGTAHTVLVISHDPTVMARADHLIRMADGVALEGSSADEGLGAS
jgi:ABC-type multidrug transport system fused ATPase/permease subunit